MKARTLFFGVASTVIFFFGCKKDGNPTPPNPNPTPSTLKCKPVNIEFVAELGTNGTTHWADSFVLDGNDKIIKVIHKYSTDDIKYDFTYINGNIVKIDRVQNSALRYSDSVFWNNSNLVERVKVYNASTLSKDIKFTYTGQHLTKREIKYYPSNDVLSQLFLYDNAGNLVKTQFFDGSNTLVFQYTYSYTTSINNKLFDNGKTVLEHLHWNSDDWEVSIFDMFNNSSKIAGNIEFLQPSQPVGNYTIVADTNTNGYITKLKSNGHDLVNINYMCK